MMGAVQPPTASDAAAPVAADHLPAEPSSPWLANAVVVLGFAVAFTTFATDSPWSWIIGLAMVVAGGLWAGYAGTGFLSAAPPTSATPEGTPTEGGDHGPAHAGASDHGHEH
jgi:hypothetical protein